MDEERMEFAGLTEAEKKIEEEIRLKTGKKDFCLASWNKHAKKQELIVKNLRKNRDLKLGQESI